MLSHLSLSILYSLSLSLSGLCPEFCAVSVLRFCCIWLLSLSALQRIMGQQGGCGPGRPLFRVLRGPALTDVPRLIALSLPVPGTVGGQLESLLHVAMALHWLQQGDAWKAGGRDRQRAFNPESVKNGTEVPLKCCGAHLGTGAREWIWRSTGDPCSNAFQEQTDDSHTSGPSYFFHHLFRPRCMAEVV